MFKETISETWKQNMKPTKANLKRARLWRRRLGVLCFLAALVMMVLMAYNLASHGVSPSAIALGIMFFILTFMGGAFIAPDKKKETKQNELPKTTFYRSRSKRSKAKS